MGKKVPLLQQAKHRNKQSANELQDERWQLQDTEAIQGVVSLALCGQ